MLPHKPLLHLKEHQKKDRKVESGVPGAPRFGFNLPSSKLDSLTPLGNRLQNANNSKNKIMEASNQEGAESKVAGGSAAVANLATLVASEKLSKEEEQPKAGPEVPMPEPSGARKTHSKLSFSNPADSTPLGKLLEWAKRERKRKLSAAERRASTKVNAAAGSHVVSATTSTSVSLEKAGGKEVKPREEPEAVSQKSAGTPEASVRTKISRSEATQSPTPLEPGLPKH
jgi:hypothetical protein